MPDDSPTARIEPAFKVGDRVALQLDLSVFELGEFPCGAKGTVTWVSPDPNGTDPVGHVRLDEPFEELDHFENELQVFLPEYGEINWASFKPAGA